MVLALTKFRGVTPDQIDAVIASLTDDEWELLEQAVLNNVHQLILDYLVEPLGMETPPIDGSALFCRLYSESLSRAAEA